MTHNTVHSEEELLPQPPKQKGKKDMSEETREPYNRGYLAALKSARDHIDRMIEAATPYPPEPRGLRVVDEKVDDPKT
jgi:hypothetical protein